MVWPIGKAFNSIYLQQKLSDIGIHNPLSVYYQFGTADNLGLTPSNVLLSEM